MCDIVSQLHTYKKILHILLCSTIYESVAVDISQRTSAFVICCIFDIKNCDDKSDKK